MPRRAMGGQGNQDLPGGEADPAADLGAHRKEYLATKWQDRLDLYENGATVVYGDEPQVVRVVLYASTQVWQKITQVQQSGGGVTTSHVYRLTDVHGFEVELTEAISHPEEWGPALVQGVASRQAPRALASLRKGKRVDFGEWWLSATEFGTVKKTVPLRDLHAFRVFQGSVTIEAGADIRITKGVDAIPNFLVFHYLLRKLRPELPEEASEAFGQRLMVRGLNKLFAAVAIVGFAIACLTSWPVDKTVLCEELSDLRSAKGDLNKHLKNLREAAEDYRGYLREGVRADSEKLERFDRSGTGFSFVSGSELDAVTVSIRRVCGSVSFQR